LLMVWFAVFEFACWLGRSKKNTSDYGPKHLTKRHEIFFGSTRFFFWRREDQFQIIENHKINEVFVVR
jgi:hypothetical protein